jgi:hypothetical protein
MARVSIIGRAEPEIFVAARIAALDDASDA